MTTATEPDLAASEAVDVEELLDALRRAGFDPQRPALLTWLVETAADRDAAYAVRDAARSDGWRSWLYGDGTGWVVLLCRSRPLRPDLVAADCGYATWLAQVHGGWLRGVSVEDPERDDEWEVLAAQVQSTPAAAAARSASPADGEEPAALPYSA